MCDRTTRCGPQQLVTFDEFTIKTTPYSLGPELLAPRFNVRIGEQQLVGCWLDGALTVRALHWGLVRAGATNAKVGYSCFFFREDGARFT